MIKIGGIIESKEHKIIANSSFVLYMGNLAKCPDKGVPGVKKQSVIKKAGLHLDHYKHRLLRQQNRF